MKEKLKTSNRRRKIQILTLTPNSWSLRKAADVFKVSKSTIQKARNLKAEKGILEMPKSVKGWTLQQATVDSVIAFYNDDEFTRQLPGKRDCVSIGKKQYMSKRRILCDLKELYAAFKEKNPEAEMKIRFSKFASLRPKCWAKRHTLDKLEHDVNMVYKVMSDTASYIKATISKDIHTIHYFSDGFAGQYKNCKHFLNICYYQEDFTMQYIWNFFATSHGKSPCDGLGGTVKRLAAKASLQRPVQNNILRAEAMFQYCNKEIHGIKFMYLTVAEMAHVKQKLAERFLVAKPIPGTRGFHQFTPLSVCSIAAIVLNVLNSSEEADYTLKFNFGNIPNKEKLELRPAQFLICVYDEQYWLSMVSEVDQENEDILVKFMHPHFPARSFRWPNRDDVCWVPNLHIVCSTEAPSLSTVTARQYTFETNELEKIRNCIDNHKSH
eukprot:Seg2032.1 transcript_id=Seg2032.1/GoldUCD/mRNA.D3Y31 product="hypothetical protein" protein_id=Seg2032.1/GoldUCD/D3Y31